MVSCKRPTGGFDNHPGQLLELDAIGGTSQLTYIARGLGLAVWLDARLAAQV